MILIKNLFFLSLKRSQTAFLTQSVHSIFQILNFLILLLFNRPEKARSTSTIAYFPNQSSIKKLPSFFARFHACSENIPVSNLRSFKNLFLLLRRFSCCSQRLSIWIWVVRHMFSCLSLYKARYKEWIKSKVPIVWVVNFFLRLPLTGCCTFTRSMFDWWCRFMNRREEERLHWFTWR